MADPLGAAASILALVGLCAKIITYIQDVKDGTTDRTRFMTEIYSTKAVLETITEPIPSLNRAGGPLQLLHRELATLDEELSKWRKRKSILWPFTKKDIEERIKAIESHKTSLIIALVDDQSKISRNIRNDVSAMRKDIAEIRSSAEQHKHRTILDWLTEVDYINQQHDFIGRRQPGTGQWLLESEEFRTWIATENQTLFCPGIPGAGKTILTSIVIDHLGSIYSSVGDSKAIGIAYLYLNFRRQNEQQAGNLIASLLKQLLLNLDPRLPIPETLQRLYDHHVKRKRPPIEEISKALQDTAALYDRVFVAIDALDECEPSQRPMFLSAIFDLQESCGLNIFATSRPLLEILDTFTCSGATRLEIRADAQDVRAYLDGQISSGRLPGFVQRNPGLQEEIKTGIVSAVDGMFLLAQLHLDSLVGKRSPKALRTCLASLPSGSGAYHLAYDEAVERIERQHHDQVELAKQVLSWITSAVRPLTTAELQHALAVEPDTMGLDEDNLPDIGDMVTVCAGLVTVDRESDVIRLVHYTTQQYFECTKALLSPNSEADITATCITYLSYDQFDDGPCKTQEEFKLRLSTNKFYDYAANCWGCHALGVEKKCWDKVVNFLRSSSKARASSQALRIYQYPYHFLQISSDGWPYLLMGSLHLVAFFELEAFIDPLLDTKLEVNAADSGGNTPLYFAIRNVHLGTVRHLLQKGAVTNIRNSVGLTPLTLAASLASPASHAIIQELLCAGADVNFSHLDGGTPFAVAVMLNNTPLFRLLLDNGADIEAVDVKGKTALSRAIQLLSYSSLQTVEQVLDFGADIKTKDHKGRTALHLAIDHEDEDAARLLLSRGVEVNHRNLTHGQTAISYAAEHGDSEKVNVLLGWPDTDPELSCNVDRTPLSYAAKEGHIDVVTLLLSDGRVKPDSKDAYGMTPLSIASRHGHIEIMKALLATGDADVNSKDGLGRTPLWWARRCHQTESEKVLLEYAEENAVRIECSGDLQVGVVGNIYLPPRPVGNEIQTMHWCDVCTLDIDRYDEFCECSSCNGGDFDICSDCYENGLRCLNSGHSLLLIKR
ncbi:ankyrin repeat-containing domain protein [Cladorrhinum samala]|uniref:Ankyrin repeat-containing domain protein n=1 Tax=Cladorrhinum samala TaxID=585594 RepID=A0AAV9I2G9_9PEZI|nr:ankyrin repeat-containing domain protein [Cladorrhinum samala]